MIPAGAELFGLHLYALPRPSRPCERGAHGYGNFRAIARDPDVYPEPERFNPQRWLDEKGQLRTDMNFFRFGFGRRVCVGAHVADKCVGHRLLL